MTSLGRLLNPFAVNPKLLDARPTQPVESAMSAGAAAPATCKRVPKACTQCRRDKSRCDRARPCEGCVRKGRTELCLDGCVACRQGKLSCDESRPCNTCIQEGRECIEDDPTAIAASRHKVAAPSTSTPPTLRPIKPHPDIHTPTAETRIKLACLACRKDNKKCAGGMKCPRCDLRGEDCVYVGRAPKFVKQRCAQCRKKNKKCDKARPCIHCAKAGVKCIDLPRKGIGRGLKVKRACVGCRADKIQCQRERPCAGCVRKKINCKERQCKVCVEKGNKCDGCRRHDHIHPDRSDSSSDFNSEEECDTVSIPSSSSTPSSRHSFLGTKVRDDPLASSSILAPLPLTTPLNLGFEPPYTHANSSPYRMYSRFSCPSTPSTHLMRPNVLPSFSVGFGAALSLSTSMSHMRTKFASDAEN